MEGVKNLLTLNHRTKGEVHGGTGGTKKALGECAPNDCGFTIMITNLSVVIRGERRDFVSPVGFSYYIVEEFSIYSSKQPI